MPDVNLTGPVAGHPLDIATQEAQQQQAAEIAMAMIKGGLTPGGAVIHTGGSNPFARDIPNFAGPIAQVMSAYMGAKGLDAAQQAQMATAKEYNERVGAAGSDLLNSMRPTEVPGMRGGTGEEPTAPSTWQDNSMEALMKGSLSQLGPVADLSKAMLAARMAGLTKQVVTGADIAGMLGKGNVRPDTLLGALTPTPYGPVFTNPGAVGLTPHIGAGPGGAVSVTPRDVPPAQTQASNAGVVQPPRQPIIAQRTPENPTSGPVTYEPEGTAKILPGYSELPSTKAETKVVESKIPELETGKTAVQNFQKLAPSLGQMIDLIQNSALGLGQDKILDAKRLGVTLGMTTDDANKIKDTQTLLKLALPQAINVLHSISSRPSQLEYQSTIDRLAASSSIDPGAAANVFKNLMTTGLNTMEFHNQNVDSASKLPAIGKEQAESYRPQITPEQILARSIGGIKTPWNFERGPEGLWTDKGIGQAPPAAAAKAGGLPAGWSVKVE